MKQVSVLSTALACRVHVMARRADARPSACQAAFAAALGRQLHLLQACWAEAEHQIRSAGPQARLLLWLDLRLQVRC